MLAERSAEACCSDERVGSERAEVIATRPSYISWRNGMNISFSWYCRRPAEASVGTAVRTGDAMLGLATVESTRPACEGTAAATLLNMVKAGGSVRRWISRV
jgi:hypothetical protein